MEYYEKIVEIPYRRFWNSYRSHFQRSRNPRRNLFKGVDEHRAYG